MKVHMITNMDLAVYEVGFDGKVIFLSVVVEVESLVALDLGSTRCFDVASMKEKNYHGLVNTAANGIDVYATCVWFLVKRSISRHQHVLIDKETAVEILVLLDLRGRISTAGYEVSTASFILSTAYEYLVLFFIQ
ncbi:hypothetical protein Tco_0291698 [Tanacetum coccineum]